MPASSSSPVVSIVNGSGVKKRAPRKAAASPAKALAREATLGEEILFKDEPNPYQAPVAPYIWIDFPTPNETLRGPVYVVRLGVGGATTVELSIDKGPWLPCRHTSGYWWYDWSAIGAGKHTLVARMRTADGQWYRTPPRTCTNRPA